MSRRSDLARFVGLVIGAAALVLLGVWAFTVKAAHHAPHVTHALDAVVVGYGKTKLAAEANARLLAGKLSAYEEVSADTTFVPEGGAYWICRLTVRFDIDDMRARPHGQ